MVITPIWQLGEVMGFVSCARVSTSRQPFVLTQQWPRPNASEAQLVYSIKLECFPV